MKINKIIHQKHDEYQTFNAPVIQQGGVESTTVRINQLHQEIVGHVKTTIEKAIEIGKLLSELKEELPHGQYTKHVKDSFVFSVETARRYKRLYDNRAKLKTVSVTDLTEAYHLISSKSLDEHEENARETELLERELKILIDTIKTRGINLKNRQQVTPVIDRLISELKKFQNMIHIQEGEVVEDYWTQVMGKLSGFTKELNRVDDSRLSEVDRKIGRKYLLELMDAIENLQMKFNN